MKCILKKLSKYFIVIYVVTFLILPSISSVPAAFRYLQEGMQAPDVVGKDMITGESVSSKELISDNILIITFWATWSERSMEMLQDLKLMMEEYKDLPMKIIAINSEKTRLEPAELAEIEKIVKEMDLPFPILIDNKLALFNEYGVIAIPSTAILDMTGMLRFAPSGYSLSTRDQIVDSVKVLLGIEVESITVALKKGYTPKNKSSRYYRLALQLMNKRMYERALANVDMAIESDTLFSAPHNLKGEILLKLETNEEALAEFSKAISLDSNSVAAMAGYGGTLLKLGRIDDAHKSLSDLLAKDSTYTPAVLDFALCLAEKQEYDKSIEMLNSAKELNRRDPAIHYNLGQIYLKTNQNNKVIESYKTALEILYPLP